MLKAIKIGLLYLLSQVVALLLVGGVRLIMPSLLPSMDDVLVWTLLLSHLILVLLLSWRGYMRPIWKQLRPCGAAMMVYGLLLGVSTIFLVDFILSYLTFLPDLNAETFDALDRSVLGIASVALTGPVAEELLFRGVITSHLSSRYQPALKVALLSGLIFGVFHLNPPQVVAATMSGFIFALLYLKSGSLLPGIIVHVINNSLSVVLNVCYPQEEDMKEIIGADLYWAVLLLSVVVFAFCFKRICYASPQES